MPAAPEVSTAAMNEAPAAITNVFRFMEIPVFQHRRNPAANHHIGLR